MADCAKCGKKLHVFDARQGLCPQCREAKGRSESAMRDQLLSGFANRPDPEAAERERLAVKMAAIILTTEASHNLAVAERLEIITAECVLGMNIFKDIGAGLRDLVGGRNEAYQTALKDARKIVLQDLRREAVQLGADAVVAVDLDYSEISGGGKSMLFLVASGTAVKLAKHNVSA